MGYVAAKSFRHAGFTFNTGDSIEVDPSKVAKMLEKGMIAEEGGDGKAATKGRAKSTAKPAKAPIDAKPA